MSDEQARRESVPKPVLIAAGLLMLGSFLFATGARIVNDQRGGDSIDAVASRDLSFEQRDNGALVVRDAEIAGAGQAAPSQVREDVIKVFDAGEGGFVRGILRGLTRDRQMRGIDLERPYRLSYTADRRLTLEDLATGYRIDLAAYGSGNVETFIEFLSPNRG